MNTSPLPPPPPSSARAYWACQILGWGSVGLSQFLLVVLVIKLPWMQSAIEIFAFSALSLMLTHWLRRFMRQHRWDALQAPTLTPRILLAGLVLGIPTGFTKSFTAASSVFEGELGGFIEIGVPGLTQFVSNAINSSATFASWMALYFIILGSRKRRWAELRQSELMRALQLAELRLLKAQLNPHFLFNSLNSVRALIADDPSRAQSAVTQLARTLRYTLASGQDELVTLKQELEIVDDYLGLESLRLGERLRIERDISPEAMRVRIPVMLMQTIVENAIKHGIAELPDGGVLRISAQVREGALLLEICNPQPVSSKLPTHEGIGLRNATERLRLLFGAAASLNLDLSDPELAVARIRLPAQ